MAKRRFRVRWLIALAFMPVAAALSRTEPDKTEQLSGAPKKEGIAYFGNAGCAASGCHNANGPRGTPGSEYSTWANEDPHSRAYGVLNSAAGQQMERLYRPNETNADATKDRLCLKCHAPMGVNHAELRADAVGCESCHGSSAQWRTTHYLNEWKCLDINEKARRGMMPTKDVTRRVELCTECHVGKKGMEVDHDLIAAGHPRLFFEYTAYHDLLPRHWREKDGPAFYARAWAIGRVTAAKAAVELLHDRAATPNRWPELAEFNCYSCHRPLSDVTTPPKDRAPGSLAAGSWHFALLKAIAGLSDEFAPPQPVDPAALLSKLHDITAKPEDIAAAAKPLVAALAAWQNNLKSVRNVDLSAMKKLLGSELPADWEQATQHYLAISALHRSQPPSDERRDGLMRLRDLLKFPPAIGDKKINSPSRFNLDNYTNEANKLLSQNTPRVAHELGAAHDVSGSHGGRLLRARLLPAIRTNSPDGAANNSLKQVPGAPLVDVSTPVGNNANHCKSCHTTELAHYTKDGIYKRITPDPSTVWEQQDPHSKAWDNIVPANNKIAQQMAKNLNYDVSRKPECLACHAVDVTPTAALESKRFSWDHSVGCEACHGNGLADTWVGLHFQPAWREKSPAEKTALGQTDLRDTSVRAKTCASCHVGNIQEGKFVTHQMYAAGHPPLLSYEPVTFSRDQPAHWRIPVDDETKSLFRARRDEDYIARSLAVGAIVNLRETARTLQQDAEKVPAGGMLDFAHFDCFACHHELVTPSQRQARGYTGTPGRPTVRTLPTELVDAVLRQLAPGSRQRLSGDLDFMRSAFDARPFGNTADIATKSRDLAKSCDDWLKELENIKYDAAGKNQLLTAIINGKNTKNWDYDTAQQFTWAVRALKSYDQVGDEWNALSKQVLLGAGLGPTRKVESSLSERLRKRYEFDAEQFVNSWKQLPK